MKIQGQIAGLTALALILAIPAAVPASSPAVTAGNTPVIGGPCEGCKNVFVGLPENLASATRIAPEDEPGEPLVIEGIVRTPGGDPAQGVIVYAYHTDRNGIYPKAETRHGKLRAWALTGKDGSYRFDTIRPASYPESRIPQHVHMHVIEAGVGTYYIDSIHFEDDPYLTERQRKQMLEGRGGGGLADPERIDGIWHVRRDIVLGENVPGYPEGS